MFYIVLSCSYQVLKGWRGHTTSMQQKAPNMVETCRIETKEKKQKDP